MNRIDTPALPVNLPAHHLRQSFSSRKFADRNLAKAPRLSDEALRMDLVIRRHGGAAEDGRFSASARLPLPGRDIHATAVHADLYTAMVKLVDRLVRRARMSKTLPINTRAARRARGRANGHGVPEPLSTSSAWAQRHRITEWDAPRQDPQTREGTTGLPGRSLAHVLLAVDYTKPSAAVTRTGAALAGKTGARLTLLHVLEPVTPDIVAPWIDFPEQRRHYELARLRLWSRDHGTTAHASCSVIEGRPWEKIVRFSTENNADLIVMGRSGSRWFGRLTARTVERVAQNSKCPVLIVGQDQQHAPFEPRRVLLTTDFSADSLEAFPWAERIARRYGAQILLANVQDPMVLPGTAAYAYFHEEIDEEREQADRKLEAWRHAHLAADLDVHTRVMEGIPAPSLCRLVESSQTDLVVMSTHGAKGWVRKWLGGTTEGLLRNVTCSVLVVPARQATEGVVG
jgi:nucleotide-binding universal stress UspA family protein/ribosome-associated translation inhibitor RaiA